MGERDAIARLQRGDIGGLEELVRQHQVRAVRTAYLITRDRELAEDIVQSAFLRVYERAAQFDPRRPFAPWFLRVVANDALKAAGRVRLISLSPDYFDELMLPSPGPELVERLEAAETSAALRAALAQLTPEERAALVLRYYLDLDASEMAARLGSPPGTVRWRLHVARRKLRQLLPAWIAPGGQGEEPQ